MSDDDPIVTKAKQLHAAGATDEQVRQFLLANGYEAGTSTAPPPAPTGHAGKPFVNAPEMLQQHKGTPFVDAEPEPSFGQQLSGAYASLGKHIAGDEQTAARALTREHGLSDIVSAIKSAPTNPVRDAFIQSAPAALVPLAMRALRDSPSYARAQQDIGAAEASAGGVGRAADAVGTGVGLAATGEGLVGLARGAMSPVASPITGGRISRLARRGVEGVRELAFPAEKGLQGPMADVADAARGQSALESRAASARPVATARPAIGEPSTPSSATAVQSPMESAADLTQAHPIAADITKTVDAPVPDVVAKAARQSHRTKASFQDFAERVSGPPRSPSPNPPSIRERILAGIALTPKP